jgi:transcription-repair coupling factor (superfamily II helicase)
MAKMAERLAEIAPEARMVQAHGRLSPTELEQVMTDSATASTTSCWRPTSLNPGWTCRR